MKRNNNHESVKYKLVLANDLIVFLCSALTASMDKSQASAFLGKIMELWTHRVHQYVSEIKKEHIERISSYGLEESPSDVFNILSEVRDILPNDLRNEFIGDVLMAIQKQVIDKKD